MNPLLNDLRVTESAVKGLSPPESRNFGLRVGTKLVHDESAFDIQRS